MKVAPTGYHTPAQRRIKFTIYLENIVIDFFHLSNKYINYLSNKHLYNVMLTRKPGAYEHIAFLCSKHPIVYGHWIYKLCILGEIQCLFIVIEHYRIIDFNWNIYRNISGKLFVQLLYYGYANIYELYLQYNVKFVHFNPFLWHTDRNY